MILSWYHKCYYPTISIWSNLRCFDFPRFLEWLTIWDGGSTRYNTWFFLRDPITDTDAHIQERTPTPINARMQPLPLWAPPKNQVGPANLEIEEVTTGASLSTSTLPTTESIALLNLGINPEKYEYPCQVKDLTRVGRFHHKEPNQLIYD